MARGWDLAEDARGDLPRPGARDAHDANAAAPGGRGDRGDGRRPQRLLFACASAASVRLMCHCCTIEMRFWTTQ